ncbi:MAG: extracellular solute-binding protein [Micrococcales bacterium]|nr:extracellular solute-binding protein [Micrococcales bacterium]
MTTHANRRAGRRWMVPVGIALASAAVLAGCSGGGTAAPVNSIAAGKYPDYYPKDYQKLVDAAKKEGGELNIYSNTDQTNWAPIFRDFKKKYPFVTTINANNLDSDEVFQRVLSEQATGGTSADIMVTGAAQGWAKFTQGKKDAVLPYTSPELSQLPDFAQPLPGVYAMSLDPSGITYNTSLLPKGITGYADLAKQVKANPAAFENKITTRDIGGSFGFTVTRALTEARPKLWSAFETILPVARPETSSGTQGEKILAGEYVAGFQISTAPSYPLEQSSGGLYKVVLPKDGTVVLPRGIGIVPEAKRTATAKLFVDFVLSKEGQNAVAEGGLTSYRDSVKSAPGLHTYQDLAKAVGKDQIIIGSYKLVTPEQVAAFTDRWNGLLAK